MTSLTKSDNYVAHLKKGNKINSDFLLLILNGDIHLGLESKRNADSKTNIAVTCW